MTLRNPPRVTEAMVVAAVNEFWNYGREKSGKPRERKLFKPDPEFAAQMRAALVAALVAEQGTK